MLVVAKPLAVGQPHILTHVSTKIGFTNLLGTEHNLAVGAI
jgi:hypothetical protein